MDETTVEGIQINRSEHLQWCKTRALEYVRLGNLQNAWSSMVSDLRKHPDTASHPAIALGFQLLMIGDLNTVEKMQRFLEGFN